MWDVRRATNVSQSKLDLSKCQRITNCILYNLHELALTGKVNYKLNIYGAGSVLMIILWHKATKDSSCGLVITGHLISKL